MSIIQNRFDLDNIIEGYKENIENGRKINTFFFQIESVKEKDWTIN